jgi:hypothetical protein
MAISLSLSLQGRRCLALSYPGCSKAKPTAETGEADAGSRPQSSAVKRPMWKHFRSRTASRTASIELLGVPVHRITGVPPDLPLSLAAEKPRIRTAEVVVRADG